MDREPEEEAPANYQLVGPWLVPEEYVDDVEDFLSLYSSDKCQCGNPGAMPPCSWCTHPGNTQGLHEAGIIIYFGE